MDRLRSRGRGGQQRRVLLFHKRCCCAISTYAGERGRCACRKSESCCRTVSYRDPSVSGLSMRFARVTALYESARREAVATTRRHHHRPLGKRKSVTSDASKSDSNEKTATKYFWFLSCHNDRRLNLNLRVRHTSRRLAHVVTREESSEDKPSRQRKKHNSSSHRYTSHSRATTLNGQTKQSGLL